MEFSSAIYRRLMLLAIVAYWLGEISAIIIGIIALGIPENIQYYSLIREGAFIGTVLYPLFMVAASLVITRLLGPILEVEKSLREGAGVAEEKMQLAQRLALESPIRFFYWIFIWGSILATFTLIYHLLAGDKSLSNILFLCIIWINTISITGIIGVFVHEGSFYIFRKTIPLPHESRSGVFVSIEKKIFYTTSFIGAWLSSAQLLQTLAFQGVHAFWKVLVLVSFQVIVALMAIRFLSNNLASNLQTLISSFLALSKIENVSGKRLGVASLDEVGHLAEAYNTLMEKSIERNEQLHEAQIKLLKLERKRLTQELNAAKEIQLALLPDNRFVQEGVIISGRSIPATEVGGDYYDFITLPDGKLGIAVGDATGHGLAPALLMAMVKSFFYNQSTRNSDPQQLSYDLNNMVVNLGNDRMMTFFYGIIDTHKGYLLYSNAGHPQPFVIRQESSHIHVLSLEQTGMVMGVMENETYPLLGCQLRQGDTIVFYTDGVTESRNCKTGKLLGTFGFQEMLMQSLREDPDDFLEEIFYRLDAFIGTEAPSDDRTVVVVRFTGHPSQNKSER